MNQRLQRITIDPQYVLEFDCESCGAQKSITDPAVAYVDCSGPILETHFHCKRCGDRITKRETVAKKPGPAR